jgi:RNA-directed DNA polymerase
VKSDFSYMNNKVKYLVLSIDTKSVNHSWHCGVRGFSGHREVIKDWHDIDWQKCHEYVSQRQTKIAVAYRQKDRNQVKCHMDTLVNSFAGRALAVRTVQTNPGKNTPGIDKVIWENPKEKRAAVHQLSRENAYVAQPVKRVWISKDGHPVRPDKSNGRPLGIPTRLDRAIQTLWALALLPVAECTADRHSYGYRPSRSTKDAQTRLSLRFRPRTRPMYVFEADIKGFFDNIDHNWIRTNIPRDKQIRKQWRKAGHLDRKQYHVSETGVPQGGPISPIIANRVLDGLQETVLRKTKSLKVTKVVVVRYADDFVITAPNEEIRKDVVILTVNDFLSERGRSFN